MSFTAALRGSARMLRLPSARGPASSAPWNQPTTFPPATNRAVVAATSRTRSYGRPAASSARRSAASSYAGPRYGWCITYRSVVPSS